MDTEKLCIKGPAYFVIQIGNTKFVFSEEGLLITRDGQTSKAINIEDN